MDKKSIRRFDVDELYKKANANQNCKLKTNISVGTMSNKLSSSLNMNFKNKKANLYY